MKTNRIMLSVMPALAMALLLPGAAAAPGKISQQPLLLPESVQSNLFIMLDDSISMASEVLPNPDSTVLLDLGPNNTIDAGVLNFTPDLSGGVADVLGSLGGLDPVSSQLLNLCVGNNLLAFDITKTYTPWRGVDSQGVPFGQQSPTAARLNPYAPDSFPIYGNDDNIRDVTANIFIDQRVSDCAGLVGTDAQSVSSLSAADQQNYANWFSYYRRREFVIKRALSEVIWNSTARLGLASAAGKPGLLSDQPIGIEVANVDTQNPEQTAAELATATANRDARLRQLFELDMDQGLLLEELLKTVDPVQLLVDLLGNNLLTSALNDLLIGRVVEALGLVNSTLNTVQQELFASVLIQNILLGASDGVSLVNDNVNGIIDIINDSNAPCVCSNILCLNCLVSNLVGDVLDVLDVVTLGITGDALTTLTNLIPDLPVLPDLDIENLVTNLISDVLSGQLLNQVGLADILFDSGNRGTPLRIGLNNVGEYFSGNVPSGMFAAAPSAQPILPEADGGVCQQNFTMVVTDGVWTGQTDPGVGNADGDNNTAFDGRSYADPYSETLADVAMRLYENDLRADLEDLVSPSAARDDLNPAQHLVTQAVGLGLRGTDFVENNPPVNRDSAYPWTDPEPNAPLTGLLLGPEDQTLAGLIPLSPLLELLGGVLDAASDQLTLVDNVNGIVDQLDPTLTRKRVDDLRHAAWNGRGLFQNAFNAEELVEAIEDITTDIEDRVGSLAETGVSVDNSGDVALYQAAFNSAFYSGMLTKRNLLFNEQLVDGETVTTATLGGIEWEAGELLAARPLLDEPRKIYTHNGSAGVSTGGLRLCWPGVTCGSKTISSTQQADLLTNYQSSFGTEAEWGNAIVNYLMGFRTNEAGVATTSARGPFRFRGGERLGDIVHSSAVVVGKPQPEYPGRGTPYADTIVSPTPLNEQITGQPDPRLYSTYVNAKQNRTALVYTGANDGMLHAFNADTGKEEFAYMPGFLFSATPGEGLHALADPDYDHRYYVDATPVIADAFLDGQWKTILVGTAGAGGRGLYAIDVTDPAAGFSESNILFEFTHPELGLGLGQPVITKVARGDSNDSNWAIILPSGYNDEGPTTTSGTAKLFIIYLDGSNLSNPIILDTAAGSVVNGDCSDAASNCNGLSSPNVVDSNGDGSADRIYAGDVLGNLWAFEDPIGDGTLNWQVANSGQPLFVARDSGGNIQPITARPSVTRLLSRPEFSTAPNILVFFGTGQYVAESDPTLSTTDSFYSVWDTGSAVPGGTSARTNLFPRSITTSGDGQTRFIDSTDFEYTPNASNGIRGWFLDTPAGSGLERFTTAPQISEDTVLVNSLIPTVGACDAAGSGFAYAFNAKTGKPPFRRFFNSAPQAGNGDNAVGQAVSGLPTRTTLVNNTKVTSGSANATPVVEDVEGLPDAPAARQSWQDLETE